MADNSSPGEGQSTWLIIGAVAIGILSLLCCGCLALAWIAGDFLIQFIEQFARVPMGVA